MCSLSEAHISISLPAEWMDETGNEEHGSSSRGNKLRSSSEMKERRRRKRRIYLFIDLFKRKKKSSLRNYNLHEERRGINNGGKIIIEMNR